MRSRLPAALMIATAAILWVAVPSGQDVRPTPGLGTGVVTVRGTVDIGNMPPLAPAQGSQWKVVLAEPAEVRVTNTPTVMTAPAEFLKAGRRYSVTWPTGLREVIVVAQAGSAGWARVESSAADGRRRWVNLAGAQTVEELGDR